MNRKGRKLTSREALADYYQNSKPRTVAGRPGNGDE